MYRNNANRCPACDAPLVALKATLPIEGCEACGGVWLGPDAAVHVLRGLHDDVEKEITRQSVTVAKRSSLLPTDQGARECPTCAQTMGRIEVVETVVDSCPAHGTWFDREELSVVVTACRRLRMHPDEDDWGVFDTVLDILTGFLRH